MIARESYDLADTPLLPGTSLIEASAGTGKTFTLVGLFLRLILDLDLSVRQILVVTFTEAATGELRGRIRDRLAEAAAAFAAAGQTTDPVLRGILRPYLARREEMIARLERALGRFDEAPIFTIHGFCQRTLRDRAFESGALFDMELLEDDSRVLQEIADDFWRRHFYQTVPLPVQFLLKNQYQPETFLPLLRIRNRHPNLTVISRVERDAPPAPLARLSESFRKAQDLWQHQQSAIRAAFGDSAVWGKSEHAKAGVVKAMWTALAACFEDGTRTPDSLEALDFLAADALEEATNARGVTPRHEFFERCQEIVERERDYRISLHLEFLDYAAREFPRRKQELKVQSFDDLLTRLHAALRSPGGPTLAGEVRAKYKAALIDEFQDTDPVQWEIFREIFGKTGGVMEYGSDGVLGKIANPNPITPILHHSNLPAPAPLLFLIGDPKQAIYGFRGADIFTYLDAAAAVDHRHTLDRNFRSESGLVRAVNTIFSAVDQPFLFDEIQFQPVKASDGADQQPLTENGERRPPMHLWFMPCEPDAKEITKEKAESILPDVVAAEIARLLNSDTRLGAAKLSPRDIAVLVPENRHAGLMQDALRARNIPSVLHTEESVFTSREARELERVLAAMARPATERLLRAALATELLGVNGPALDELSRQESEGQRRRERFLGGHTLWLEKGFTPMFRHWLHDEAVRQRLKFADGERRLTNVLHLGEVLHQATLVHRLGPTGLVRWLSAQIVNEEKAAEEHQLRLERDDQAVKLVTIHKSKGLEYPVVFCPFSWKSSETRRGRAGIDPVFYHERSAPEAGGSGRATRFFCDLGSKDVEAHRDFAFAEKLAENLRLLYVALTRARNRCYFVWGTFRGAGTSAAAWLFHPPTSTDEPQPSGRTSFQPVSNPSGRTGFQPVSGLSGRTSFQPVSGLSGRTGFQPVSGLSGRTGFQPVSHPSGRTSFQPVSRLQEAMTARFKSLSDAAMFAELQRLVARSTEGGAEAAILVEPLPPASGPGYRPPGKTAEVLRARPFTGRIARDWRVVSFSGLAAGRREETPDYDAAPDAAIDLAEPAAEPRGIFAFPRGAKAGTCLHKIFEVLDFQEEADEVLRLLVRGKLSDHGFPPDDFTDTICAMVRRTLTVPLASDRRDFTLARVPKGERLNELEFQFPIEKLTPALLQTGFAGAGSPPEFLTQLARLDFEAVGGFVKGFIDLVFRFDGRFYIVDWKSNWLGSRVEDYGPAVLARAMAEQFYTLQYHLYAVALHRYLKLRLRGYDYEKHFGGVRYLFLRGLDPARPEMGVFRDRPAAAWVEELSARLAGGRREGIA